MIGTPITRTWSPPSHVNDQLFPIPCTTTEPFPFHRSHGCWSINVCGDILEDRKGTGHKLPGDAKRWCCSCQTCTSLHSQWPSRQPKQASGCHRITYMNSWMDFIREFWAPVSGDQLTRQSCTILEWECSCEPPCRQSHVDYGSDCCETHRRRPVMGDDPIPLGLHVLVLKVKSLDDFLYQPILRSSHLPPLLHYAPTNMNDFRESKQYCYFHPKQLVVGICAQCLRDRLLLLESKQAHLPRTKDGIRSFRVLKRKSIIALPKIFALGSFVHLLEPHHRENKDHSEDEGSIDSLEGKRLV